jgi:hypothetical protein
VSGRIGTGQCTGWDKGTFSIEQGGQWGEEERTAIQVRRYHAVQVHPLSPILYQSNNQDQWSQQQRAGRRTRRWSRSRAKPKVVASVTSEVGRLHGDSRRVVSSYIYESPQSGAELSRTPRTTKYSCLIIVIQPICPPTQYKAPLTLSHRFTVIIPQIMLDATGHWPWSDEFRSGTWLR